jgi:hypothetical protein
MARPRKSDTYSIAELKALISERRRRMIDLKREHTQLSRKLAQIDHEMDMLGGAGGRRGIRPRNEKNLVDVMEDVMKGNGKPMRVGDITDGVYDAGYRSSSANFRGIVNQTLIKDKRFIAAERGLYQLRK